MITDRGLAALRVAATVNHLYPTLSTSLGAGPCTVIRVSAPCAWSEHGSIADHLAADPAPGGEVGLELTPCGFRAATAGAWAQHRSGRRLRLLDLDADPAVVVDPAPGDRVWPSGIARVRTRDTVAYVFGTFLSPDRCRAHAQDLLDASPAPDGLLDLLLQRDTDTDVTVVSAEVEPAAVDLVEGEVLELFEALVARFAMIELLDDMAPERARP